MVYLDNNATTPLDERVLEAMLPFLKEGYGNPSAVYQLGRGSRAAVEYAREQVAHLLGAHPSQIVFTSGGTEANNFAIKGAAGGMAAKSYVVSSVEHPSVLDPLRGLSRGGAIVNEIAVDEYGVVQPASFEALLREVKPDFASVMWANNETGTMMPVTELAQIAKEQGCVFHTDAVQAVGKVPVNCSAGPIGLLSVSAHKLYGPKGAGALVVDKALDIQPLLEGGGQEKGRRSGTENVPAIVGFGMAAELAALELSVRAEGQRALLQELESKLEEFPEVVVFSRAPNRLPNTLFFSVRGIEGEALLMALDRENIAVASGSACSSKKGKASHVLHAMGIAEDIARNAVRVSLGKQNTKTDIERFLQVLQEQINLMKRMSSVVAHL